MHHAGDGLGDHARDHVARVDGLVLLHVVAQAAGRDSLALHCLGEVGAVGLRECVAVLTQRDAKLWIFYLCHDVKKLKFIDKWLIARVPFSRHADIHRLF